MPSLYRAVRRLISKVVYGLFPSLRFHRHRNAFASHMPILIGVARAARPRRLLELGAGFFSTPAFLDRRLFPSLESILSLEDDPDWIARLTARIGGDPRLSLTSVPVVPDWAAEADLTSFDLIFVDDSTMVGERARTVRNVLMRARADAIVVIHDFQQAQYQAAVPAPWTAFTFDVLSPATGVVFQTGISRHQLEAIRAVIQANKGAPASKPLRWAKAFDSKGAAMTLHDAGTRTDKTST